MSATNPDDPATWGQGTAPSACCAPGARDAATPPSSPGSPGSPAGGRDEAPHPHPRPQELDLIAVPGGSFLMGSDDAWSYPEDREGPVRRRDVAAFHIGRGPVTNAQFARFVKATDHVTDAERFGSSFVFHSQVSGGTDGLARVLGAPWWVEVPGAHWRRPYGPAGGESTRADLPVVHVSHRDAQAFCGWSGTTLPSEAQWEFAARGGLEQQPFPWGGDIEPHGDPMMAIFQGPFPHPSRPVGPVPVGTFAANSFGVENCTGNVWEWTNDLFALTRPSDNLVRARKIRRPDR